jgi:hypothetical protein
MKLRHIAKFKTSFVVDDFLSWFSSELSVIDSNFQMDQTSSKYDYTLNVHLNEIEMSYTVVKNPSEAGSYSIIVEPKLKFLDALFGKPDNQQIKAINLAHQVLSHSK